MISFQAEKHLFHMFERKSDSARISRILGKTVKVFWSGLNENYVIANGSGTSKITEFETHQPINVGEIRRIMHISNTVSNKDVVRQYKSKIESAKEKRQEEIRLRAKDVAKDFVDIGILGKKSVVV